MIGEITAYSIISAVLFFNLGLIFVGVLRKNTIFLVKSKQYGSIGIAVCSFYC
ncbi:MAG: hypothetical protein ACLUUG_01300 [Lachnospiraceae bacterium]